MTVQKTNPLKRIAAFILVVTLVIGSIHVPVLAAYDNNTDNIYIAQDEYWPADDTNSDDTQPSYLYTNENDQYNNETYDDTTNYTPPPVYSR